MAQIAVSPFVLKDVIFSVATDDYEAHVSEVSFTPSSSTQTWQGLTPDATFTDTTIATWVCTLAYAQDWETANSLSQYLFTNEGDTVAVEFSPKSGSGPSFTANIVITPGAIGGTVGTFATATVTLGCDKPVLVPAA